MPPAETRMIPITVRIPVALPNKNQSTIPVNTNREKFNGEIFIFNDEIFIFNDEIFFSYGEIF